MPLAGTSRPPRLLTELDSFFPTNESYSQGSLYENLIAEWLLSNPQLAHELRLVLSLSDKRFYLDMSYQFSREIVGETDSDGTICGCPPQSMKRHSTATILNMMQSGSPLRRRRAAEVIAHYLVDRQLLVVLDLYFSLDQNQRTAINDLWLAPHDVQQNETKRRGHGAEAEIAVALNAAGIKLIPENKGTDPMGGTDPNINLDIFEIVDRKPGKTISCDIAVLDSEDNLQIMIMGLVQSSDPGQFGVDKAATNTVIRDRLNTYRASTGSTLELWGIVDGIGYAENPNGTINRMLEAFDVFIQHNSAYKAILHAHRLGLCQVYAINYDEDFYSENSSQQMHERYGAGIVKVDKLSDWKTDKKSIRAGRATIWID